MGNTYCKQIRKRKFKSTSRMIPLKVTIVGSGQWGTTIASICGDNVSVYLDKFSPEVIMWVKEEMVDGNKLSDIINMRHENVKYLPGVILPNNVKAEPDPIRACRDADILVFVMPHMFVREICLMLRGNIKKDAAAISLIKGFEIQHEENKKGLLLMSELIRNILNIPCAVFMGANIAKEVIADNFCEGTIGCKDQNYLGQLFKTLIQTDNLRVVVTDDELTVEICGALKNVVATAVGFVNGLGYGENTKAAVIRLGLMEMIRFCDEFYPGARLETFFESCGIADLITTCYGGRNKLVAETFARTGRSLVQLEVDLLQGGKLQGPPTALGVNYMLKAKKRSHLFPLFTSVHEICIGVMPVGNIIECLRKHPVHF